MVSHWPTRTSNPRTTKPPNQVPAQRSKTRIPSRLQLAGAELTATLPRQAQQSALRLSRDQLSSNLNCLINCREQSCVWWLKSFWARNIAKSAQVVFPTAKRAKTSTLSAVAQIFKHPHSSLCVPLKFNQKPEAAILTSPPNNSKSRTCLTRTVVLPGFAGDFCRSHRVSFCLSAPLLETQTRAESRLRANTWPRPRLGGVKHRLGA